MTTRLTVLLVTMLSSVGCDQVTKSAARMHLAHGATVSLFGDVLRLQYIENSGAFLSLGQSLPAGTRHALFTFGGALLIGAAILWALLSARMTRFQTIGAALICGGGLGNMIDRISHSGYVTDFLNVGIGNLRTGIFNLADFALLVGVMIVAASGVAKKAAA
jgi:signal peptidase II